MMLHRRNGIIVPNIPAKVHELAFNALGDMLLNLIGAFRNAEIAAPYVVQPARA